ncbi:DUF4133 domain-containing protein [Arachidicoccus sp.]|uniref:DUF4133 domain-containing protein n=1 Tax=Arachidicoccus sp. TaxID=1872624 RepID=UPI003D223C5A
MNGSVYVLNKGVNKSIEFKGLKAQYIWFLGAGLVALLVVFALLYILGINAYLCIAMILSAGAILTANIYKMSRQYGQYGMMKQLAKKALPTAIKNNSRQVFFLLED